MYGLFYLMIVYYYDFIDEEVVLERFIGEINKNIKE